jgi:hypothetical protein
MVTIVSAYPSASIFREENNRTLQKNCLITMHYSLGWTRCSMIYADVSEELSSSSLQMEEIGTKETCYLFPDYTASHTRIRMSVILTSIIMRTSKLKIEFHCIKRQVQGICLHSKASKPALRPTQSPIQQTRGFARGRAAGV